MLWEGILLSEGSLIGIVDDFEVIWTLFWYFEGVCSRIFLRNFPKIRKNSIYGVMGRVNRYFEEK